MRGVRIADERRTFSRLLHDLGRFFLGLKERLDALRRLDGLRGAGELCVLNGGGVRDRFTIFWADCVVVEGFKSWIGGWPGPGG